MGADDHGGRELVGDANTVDALEGVPPDAAAELADADVTPTDLTEKAVTYMDLVEAGVDREVAGEIRRHYSLTWASRMGDGLDDRAEEMGGLQQGERDWVAASTADWEDLGVPEYDPVEREPIDFWADHERPTPVETVVNDWVAERLAEAGISSVRQLAWVDASALAEALDVNVMQARTWRFAARDAR
ncbi:DUF7409 domain-containing protein [Haloarchaeobius amylolyticus]|uniref:DUF7409 domain-containing protein n=1 Tax=Haloarchaeobius amylolyticus TaxID=1198296 RepID=UPI002271CDF9|nr:hypothetical protein [Haloarchaeobius amylolyticus]